MQQANSARKPLNAGDDMNIFDAQPSSANSITKHRTPLTVANQGSSQSLNHHQQHQQSSSSSPPRSPNNAHRANMTYTPPQHQHNHNHSHQNKPQQSSPPQVHRSRSNNHGFSTNFTKANSMSTMTTPPRQLSPTRSTNVPEGFRIAKRELWWKESHKESHKFLLNDKPKVDHVTPRIDCHNSNYVPEQSSKVILSQKLEWHANHAVDTWSNIKHEPQGGNRMYPTEELEWHALPKVDSGFVYTFE